MRRWGTTAVVALALALVGSGCGSALIALWPKRTERHRVTVSEPVTIRGNVPGAIVTTADGKTVLGPSPYELAAEFDVERSWKERRLAVGWLAFGVALAEATGGTYLLITGEVDSALGIGAMGLGVFDMLFSIRSIIRSGNALARARARTRRHPRQYSYALRWPDLDPVVVSLTVPGAREIVGKRPTQVTFSQAVLHWEREAEIEPSGEALFELGMAHLTAAERDGDVERAKRAARYFERYAAEPGATRLQQAQRMLERARAVKP
jgi:hypothetical protein